MTHERAAEAEALPRFNEHTPLPWKEGTMGVWIFGGVPPSGTGDIICEMPTDAPDSIENWPTNRAFILEACNTYYTRLSALSAKEQEVRELVEALRYQRKITQDLNDEGMHIEIEFIDELLAKHPQP